MHPNVESLINTLISSITEHSQEIEKQRYDVSWKQDGSPVTRADVYVEALVGEILNDFEEPVCLISEESYRANGLPALESWVAILDPIDGTENFCSGLKEWGISFALWHRGIHQGSLLYMPELGEKLVSGQPPHYVNSRIQGLSSSMCPAIRDRLAHDGEYRIMGCCVYNMFNVIRGAFARFTNPKGAWIWDLLPGLVLAWENNCEVYVNECRYNGEFLHPDQRYRIDIQHRYDLHSG